MRYTAYVNLSSYYCIDDKFLVRLPHPSVYVNAAIVSVRVYVVFHIFQSQHVIIKHVIIKYDDNDNDDDASCFV